MLAVRIGSYLFALPRDYTEEKWLELFKVAEANALRRGDNAPYIRYRTSTGVTGAVAALKSLLVLHLSPNESLEVRCKFVALDGGPTVTPKLGDERPEVWQA